MTAYTAVVEQLRRGFRTGQTLSIDFRKAQLKRLLQLVTDNQDQLTDAIYKDIRRSKAEGFCFEVLFIINEINTALQELDSWVKPRKVRKNLLQLLDSAYTVRDPLGVVLIIAPWNYPVQLVFCPLVGALAAGNCAVLKPSEISPHTASIISKLVPQYLEPDVVRVVCGGAAETDELLRERFDHIFYTGSPNIARLVMRAASAHLTPVTLELGGKCPAFVDRDVDLAVAAKRLTWGKFMSCGQTCLAPDYVICHSDTRHPLVEAIRTALKELYSDNPQKVIDYSRIISERRFDAIVPLLSSSGRVAFGGRTDRDDLYIEPTVLVDVNPTDDIMKDEIFGPILPVLTVGSTEEAVELITAGEKPLAVYVFSNRRRVVDALIRRTSSGGVTVNDVIFHCALDTLPFGGVGQSGMGSYHGKFSFDTFSHEKAVLHRGLSGESILWMRYPPYDDKKFYWASLMSTKRSLPQFWLIKYVPLFFIGLLLGYLLNHLYAIFGSA